MVVDPKGLTIPLVVDDGRVDLSPLGWKSWPVDQRDAIAHWVRHGDDPTTLHDGARG